MLNVNHVVFVKLLTQVLFTEDMFMPIFISYFVRINKNIKQGKKLISYILKVFSNRFL